MQSVARAGVGAWGTALSVDSLALEGGSAQLSSQELGTIDGEESSLCRTGAVWRTCTDAEGLLEPALYAYPSCDPAAIACVAICMSDLSVAGGSSTFLHTNLWSHLHPAVALSRSDERGCNMMAAAWRRGLSWRPGYTPSTVLASVEQRPGTIPFGVGSLTIDGAPALQEELTGREQPDYRRGMFVVFQVCDPPSAPVEPEHELCYGRGVEDVSAELLDDNGTPLTEAWAVPNYLAAQSSVPEVGRTTTSRNATGYFFNVPPGEYRIRLNAPPGRRLVCELDPANTGLKPGWPDQGAEHVYRALAEEGTTVVAVRAFCELQ